MSQYPGYPNYGGGVARRAVAATGTLSTFMNLVYAWMAVGLALTAVVAWLVASSESALRTVFQPGVVIVLLVVELGLVWVISAAIEKLSATAATGLFLLYSAINGLTMSFVFVVYELGSVGLVFLITGGMFGAMSVVGYVTKKDLTSLGGFLFMALIGIILASLVNMFMQSPALYWVITYVGVFIFLGLTAYDTQKLKEIAYATEGDPELAQRLAIVGSLSLYLDFINLFLLLLRILGKARE